MSRKKFNTDINLRIKMIREQKSLTQQQFAEYLGMAQGFLSELERGRYKPRKPLLLAISYLYKINYEWLITGKGEKEEAEKPLILREPEIKYNESSTTYDEFVYVPQMKSLISAGGGLIPDTMIEMKIAFRRDWIQRKGNPENMSLIRATGDSMEPTLKPGDIVLIDHSRNDVDPHGGIYAIAVDGQIMIKRLQILYPSKKIKIISDNAKYESTEVDSDHLNINGKVIWYGRELER
jgi:phage repressor protein C with HTH and peptisase S24 domain